jgi:hypothetical protein
MKEIVMRIWRRFVTGLMVLCVFTGLGTSGEAQTARFSGTYKYAGTPEQEQARAASIEAAISGMSSFAKGTARSRITASTQILPSYSFSFEPGRIKVLPQGRPQAVSGDKGEPAEYVYNGKKSTLTQVIAGNKITQLFDSGDGKRQNEFTFSPDGQQMTLKVTLTTPRLTSPVVYSLSYKKVD